MGSLYTYQCHSCEYTVESSGKLDYGFTAVIKPYICTDCKEVCDVLVVEMGHEIPKEILGDFVDEEELEEYYSCPECKGKSLVLWNPSYRKCPKCNGRMTVDKSKGILMWD